ncbi:MAG: D-alanyl-D-alanine carboxypeptidase [Clostridia bacterium]|nr:D-alanyl-D-alanine carboxypeptidase [Clostridia bacterium]
MSQNSWQDKSYGEYFENLEKGLNNSKPKAEPKKSASKPQNSPKIYKVLRLRKWVLAVIGLFLIATVTISSVGAAFLIKKISGSKAKDLETTSKTEEKVEENKPKPQKISYDFPENTPDILSSNDAKNAVIISLSENKVIAARNANEKAYPASTTKVMTLLVAAEHLTDLDDTFTMSYEITDPLYVKEASVAGFLNDEIITVKDLFYGTILPSGADAATALAIMAAGSEEKFVNLMNKKVKALGLKNTHFDNVTGLHSEQNYSSAYDMAVILNAAMNNEFCKEILSTYQYRTTKTPQHSDGLLLSNTIFEYMYGSEPETATILGGKTGFVSESGYCIASFGEHNETKNEYIVVTFGNSSRWPAFYGQIDLYKNLK